jgi:hypothetical protein
MTIQKDQLCSLYQSLGAKFSGGRVHIDLGAKGSLAVDESVFLEPSEQGFAALNETIKREIGVEFELFDPKDKRYQAELAGNYERYFGRVWHHDEWVCCPVKKRTYYTYVKLTAPMSEVSPDSWEKMAQYLVCLLATLGILVFLGIITGGTSVAASIALFSTVAGACVAAVIALNQSEKEAAIISTSVGR